MTTLVEAYKVIDEAADGLRGFVEEHLRFAPDAEFHFLVLLDDQRGGTTITHNYQQPDGTPDVEKSLIGLGLAWRNLVKGVAHPVAEYELPEIIRKAFGEEHD